MRYYLAVVLLVVGLAACAEQPAPGAAMSAGGPVEIGDAIVAMWTKNIYYEGKVSSLDGNFVMVAWAGRDGQNPVGLADIYPLPKAGAALDVKVGEYVLVKHSVGTRWYGAQVTNLDQDAISVTYTSDGTKVVVPPEKVLVVHPGVAADLAAEAGKAS
jgi:hypothetical protein